MLDIRLRVYKFDPEIDAESSFADYNLSIREDQTVLDCMLRVRNEIDGSVAFRRSCRSGICGSCGVTVNGEPRLACETKMLDVMSDGRVTLEPLSYFRVMKDLVVDIDPFLDSLKRSVPWLVLRHDHDGKMSPEVLKKIENPATCILCGLCQAASGPDATIDQLPNPAAAAKSYRMGLDTRDALGMARVAIARDLGIITAGDNARLAEVCPKGVEFDKIMPALAAGLRG